MKYTSVVSDSLYYLRRFTKHGKNFKQPVLIYIQTLTVKINLSRAGCILPVSVYMCTIRLTELKLLGKTLNKHHAIRRHFSKMQLVSYYFTRFCMNQYPSFIYTKNQPYIIPIVGLRFFLQDTGIEKPDYIENAKWNCKKNRQH